MNWLSKLSSGLARGVTTLSPSCKEATRLQSAAMDRTLSLNERLGLRFHLLLCKWCRRYEAHVKFLRSAARQCDDHDDPKQRQGLSPEARERIKQKLQSGQG